MEILLPAPYFTNLNWWLEESKSMKWTQEENKMFENALAVYDKESPDRWHKVALMIPGKTVGDVIRQYQELEVDVNNIEAGLIPIPGYSTSPLTLDWVNSNDYDGFNQYYAVGGNRSSSVTSRPSDQERKKGVPWTEEEHKKFLMGLKKYGKGDWRNISRNFVITRTPTQVASHAQKYFIRQLSGGKDKRRASIHDITTVNLSDPRTPSPDGKRTPSPDQSIVIQQQQQPNSGGIPITHFQWNHPNNGSRSTMSFNGPQGNMFTSSPYGIDSYVVKMQEQNLHRAQIMGFHMQSVRHYSHG